MRSVELFRKRLIGLTSPQVDLLLSRGWKAEDAYLEIAQVVMLDQR